MKNLITVLCLVLPSILLVNTSCKKDKSCETCNESNKPPTAMAGIDQVITLPVNSVILDGSASTDPDGTITGWYWSKISGPSSFNIQQETLSVTTVQNLVEGIYKFELKVTDDEGLTDRDTMQVIVNPVATTNQPPLANAGPDKTIILPLNNILLDGSGSSDPDNNISSFQWTKIAGPSSFSISNASAMLTQVTSLVLGTYLFELKVTDAGGLSDTDTLMVMVEVNSPSVDIYVAGGYGAPKYWKNSQEVLLNPDLPGEDLASSIAVVGNDVYVAGNDESFWPGGSSWPRYWKNGQEVKLTNGTTSAGTTSIAVAGNDVYVAGWEYAGSNSLAVYWRNGQKVVLTNSLNEGGATCIAIVGNDVYVSGNESNGSGIHVAKYWKNGQAVVLTNGMFSAFATSIAVVGNDVYVSGCEYIGSKSVACYWKNGQKVMLTNGMNDALSTSIAVVGNDVYVTGHEGNNNISNFVAKYWKNGQEFLLPNGRFATSIAIYGSDVYIAGYTNSFSGGNSARYWKNGQEVMLPNGFYATSIAVVPR